MSEKIDMKVRIELSRVSLDEKRKIIGVDPVTMVLGGPPMHLITKVYPDSDLSGNALRFVCCIRLLR